MIVLLVCRALTADHGPAMVTGAFEKRGGYSGDSRPYQTHSHTDAADYECELVKGIDEAIPRAYPHRMKDGTVIADGDAYRAYCARYIP